ncbi:Antibiotic biosynthesis monooxygenase [Lentzea albidocapillata subsp. violacea]|uniref:Antibiotic biosynthesis monooxygenase n=1 Tax=Lentzea albidocapillata subsp. violacea TaxID=128104 RepID=A0A1G9LSC7_9PSEU|nr:antibiotic biosynthesis monooxygenase [Lentzea albidocapillata]SDL64848.1 Antibiotic biosynthesis monooxygenase [Lentzea albidocapillata subsp. violacea]
MNGEIEVVLHHLCDDENAIGVAYVESSRRMAGTPGLLGNHLMRLLGDERGFAVVSRWADWESFSRWEGSTGHKDQTAPLRPYRDLSRARPFEIYRVVAAHAEVGRG